MNHIEIVKTILSHIGDDPAQDRALAQGCIVILGNADREESVPQPEPKPVKPAAKPKRPKQSDPKKPPFDTGKMKALYECGWSAAMVADEMGVSVQTIYNKAKKEGLKFGKASSI